MSKSSKILVGIVILLGVIYAIQRLTSSTSTTVTLKPFAKIDTSQISKISIDNGKEIVMERSGEGWKLTSPISFPASQEQVSSFLNRIAGDPSGAVVSDRLADSSAYGLRASSPLLTLTQINGKTTSFRVGDVTPDFDGCYIEKAGSNQVMELSTNIRSLLGQNTSEWRDKQIFGMNISEVTSADFSVGDTLYHFFRSDTSWQLNGVKLPASRARAVLESLIGTNAIGFVDTVTNASTHMLEYAITLKNSQRISGVLFDLAGQVCLTCSSNNQTYTVSSMLPQTLLSGLRNLRKVYLTKESS